jgi:hypothetical protein
MRFKLAIILTLIIPNIMKSQNATATLENALSCSGQSVLVACNVTGFMDVAAMTIYIGYDTNEAEFVSLQNINPAVTGFLTTNASDGQIGIAYSNVNPFNLSSGKLFDLQFNFLGDSTSLPFNPGTEIANSSLEVIPLDTFPGSISNGFVIIDQPDTIQAYPDNDVMFTIASTGIVTYQWQENTGNGWNDLQNNQTYSGVTNDTLIVIDVPLSFNGYLFRCLVSAGNCSDTSGIALLEVATAYPSATLGTLLSCPENQVLEPLFVGDLFDMVEFTFIISYDPSNLEVLGYTNLNPAFVNNFSGIISPGTVTFHWEDINPVSIISGKLVDIMFDYHSQNNPVVFQSGTEVINSQSNAVDLTLTNGFINQYELPVITQQPQATTVTEGDDALFEVTATGATGYNWMISTDDGATWTDLTEGSPYFNVATPQLTISPTSLSMNGDLFECAVENENCAVLSNPAILSIDSLDFAGNMQRLPFDISVQPNPAHNKLNITLTEKCSDFEIYIYGIQGELIFSRVEKGNSADAITIDLSGLSNGLFLLEMTGKYQNKQFIDTRKILKSN